jgi:hypothetical protein
MGNANKSPGIYSPKKVVKFRCNFLCHLLLCATSVTIHSSFFCIDTTCFGLTGHLQRYRFIWLRNLLLTVSTTTWLTYINAIQAKGFSCKWLTYINAIQAKGFSSKWLTYINAIQAKGFSCKWLIHLKAIQAKRFSCKWLIHLKAILAKRFSCKWLIHLKAIQAKRFSCKWPIHLKEIQAEGSLATNKFVSSRSVLCCAWFVVSVTLKIRSDCGIWDAICYLIHGYKNRMLTFIHGLGQRRNKETGWRCYSG